jgi:hypothetical protein
MDGGKGNRSTWRLVWRQNPAVRRSVCDLVSATKLVTFSLPSVELKSAAARIVENITYISLSELKKTFRMFL